MVKLKHHWTTYLTWLLPHTWAHEGGHWLTLYFLTGHKLTFKPQGYRWIWDFPEGVSKPHKLLTNYAGFAGEFLLSGIFFTLGPFWGWGYLFGCVGHFMAYPHYVGQHNDFEVVK